MKMKNILSSAAIASMIALLLSTNAQAQEHEHEEMEVELPTLAVCVLQATKGNSVKGYVTFEKEDDGVMIKGKVVGLTPGKHGFHIHMFGDLRASDGTSAGGHFNPEGTEHGSPEGDDHHMGDLGNIVADQSGVANIEMKSKKMVLHYILGRSIVVHAGEDDFTSQPSGDAGPRVAVGVIGFGNAQVVAETDLAAPRRPTSSSAESSPKSTTKEIKDKK